MVTQIRSNALRLALKIRIEFVPYSACELHTAFAQIGTQFVSPLYEFGMNVHCFFHSVSSPRYNEDVSVLVHACLPTFPARPPPP